MPFQFEVLTSASGLHYLRIDASGRIELADAKAFEAHMLQPQLRDGLVLSVVSKGTEYSPEARKFFPSMKDKTSKVAGVVTSPIVRAAINMMLRLDNEAGKRMRLFTSEQEAMNWLEGGPSPSGSERHAI
jgi:hypothetical protein